MKVTTEAASAVSSSFVLKGLGPKTRACLEKLNIRTIQALLFHLPLRYEDRTKITPMHRLRWGVPALVEGKIESAGIVFRGRRQFMCRLTDGTGFLTLRFFHFTPAQQKAWVKGLTLRCFGEIRAGQIGYEIVHPEYRRINPEHPLPLESRLTAVYPTVQGLSQTRWRQFIQEALFLSSSSESWTEWLPEEILKKLQLFTEIPKHGQDGQFFGKVERKVDENAEHTPVCEHFEEIFRSRLPKNGCPLMAVNSYKKFYFPELSQAVSYLHQPPLDADLHLLQEGRHPYQQRLIFEELLAHHLSLRRLKNTAQCREANAFIETHRYTRPFLEALPFALTKAQRRVMTEIKMDLEKPHPMQRLVQGDVGSGKTVVAAYAALLAAEQGHQTAFMAPTELLVEQHLSSFKRWLEPLGVEVMGLTSQLTARARRETLEKIKQGQAKLVIGTHALFQKDVEFQELALMIVDEQHRFGVHQRLSLHEKGRRGKQFPHQLVMTATPIPRTLAMLAYADLDYSMIDEMPADRKPIKTSLISNERRKDVMERARHFCLKGHQVYWVCPLIEESEVLQCQAAENTVLELRRAWPELNVALVHGRMKADERDLIMKGFKEAHYQVLVATTVVEVGVDVPNACLMVIENAERLGLAQLHQLRGRVGRGPKESYCLLLYQPPLSSRAKERLAILRKTQNGFIIAQKDLMLRGPGEILGIKQSGLMQLKIADLIRDRALLPAVVEAAEFISRKYPQNIPPLIDRWISIAEQYSRV